MKRFRDTKYLVTEDGQVFSEHRNKYLLAEFANGYRRVTISIGKREYIHRMVAECYIPNPNNYKQVNHINNDRLDNRVENLEWCSTQMNTEHCVKQGRNAKGSNIYQSKLNNEQVKEIRRIYENKELSISKIAILFKVSRGTIQPILKRITWKHVL